MVLREAVGEGGGGVGAGVHQASGAEQAEALPEQGAAQVFALAMVVVADDDDIVDDHKTRRDRPAACKFAIPP